jgi:AcrR family transcriptional regulator
MSQIELVPERLLRHAIILFAQRGFDATSVQDIVDAANVTKGAFYYYFTSKDDLLYHIHDQVVSYEMTHAETILGQGMPPWDTLQALIVDGVESIGLFREEVTVSLREMHRLQPEYFEKIKTVRAKYQAIFETVIRQGQEAGVFRTDIPANIATLALLGMSNWMYTWFRANESLTSGEIGELFAKLFLTGLKA